MKRPYLSLSALSGPDDASAILRRMTDIPPTHDLMLGVAMDTRSGTGELPPSARKLADISTLRRLSEAVEAPALLAVHFECLRYQKAMTTMTDVFEYARVVTAPFADLLLKLLDAVPAERVGAVQLNGIVDPDELRKVHERRPDVPVVYQLRRELMERGESDMIAHLNACRAHISHILIDLSAGCGIALSDDERSTIASLVRMNVPEARIGIAGGISVANVGTMYAAAYDQLGHVGVDAETSIRNPETDAFDVTRALDFLGAAAVAVRSSEDRG